MMKYFINVNKYQSKVSTQTWNRYLDFLIHTSFQEINRLSALPFENLGDRTFHTSYFFRKLKTFNCTAMADGRNVFLQLTKNKKITMIIFIKWKWKFIRNRYN